MAIPNRQIGWSQESNLLWEISRQMEKLTGVAFNGGGGGGGTPLIIKTKSQIDSLILSNGLIPGQTYLITGVDVPLYGGTDIIIQATTTNQLALQGHGIFYTPKYDQSLQGYGIWSKNILYTASFDDGPFDIGEIVELTSPSDTVLGTAIFKNQGLLEWISGSTSDWTDSGNYIHGVDSSYNAGDFNVVNFPTSINPNPGDLTIWGGRVWSNDSGGTGSSTDQFTLDADWNVIPYNTTDYNISIDVIHYDYEHDRIVSRKDKFDNEVSFNYAFLNYQNNPIKVFQWGNGYDYNTEHGISGCKVLDSSYFECINFRGSYIWDVKLINESYINNITFEGYGATMQYITLSNNSQMYNVINSNSPIEIINISEGSYVYNLNLNQAYFNRNDVISSSYIYNIYFEKLFSFNYNFISNGSSINNVTSFSGSIANNKIDQNSNIYNIFPSFSYSTNIIYNTLVNSSTINNNNIYGGYISYNSLLKNSQIINNTLQNDSGISNNILTNNGGISYNSLNSGGISNNNIFLGNINSIMLTAGSFSQSDISGTNVAFTLAPGQNLSKIKASNAGSFNYDLTTGATLIFNTFADKNIFLNSSGIIRMSYYDALDTLQVVNVNA